MSQSSNDVIPTAIHLSAALAVSESLLPALTHLAETLEKKAATVRGVAKTGRTHLMDAMPITLGQELGGWAAQIRNGIARVRSVQPRLHALPQGGTAVGTGINAHPEFAARIAAQLSNETGLALRPNDNFFESLSSQDTAVELSGQLKVVAVSIMKIANDLRWMNSGPLAGLGEIELTALQPGSSIMPGKVNPVIPEAADDGRRTGDRQRHDDHDRRPVRQLPVERDAAGDRAAICCRASSCSRTCRVCWRTTRSPASSCGRTTSTLRSRATRFS